MAALTTARVTFAMADSAHSTPAPRRDFLKLFGLTALPPGVVGALAFSDKTDLTVIRAAREAARLKAVHGEARRALFECEEVFNTAVLPSEPPKPDTEAGQAAISRAIVSLLGCFPVITPEVEAAVTELRRRSVDEMWTTYRAWLKQWERVAVTSGLNDADKAYDKATDAMVGSVNALAGNRATTLEGLLAKAAVFEEDPHDDQLDTHQQALALSVMRDLQAMIGSGVIA